MKYSIILAALMATLGLAACEKTVVKSPDAAPVVVVPGPSGPTGATGAAGSKGETGKTGDAVVVVPAK